ncbi:MAG: zinc metallopeptidase [Gemmatimonadota bacterium]|nr:MAG: zinc metallopeptidase [Gemmatimonadota bacterium]
MFFDPIYFVIVGPAMLLALWAQMKVKGAYGTWSQQPASSRLTGAQAASRMLQSAGILDVQVEQVQGFLSDHYDPRAKKLRLSPDVYGGQSVAAMGIACHEAGHAMQHAQGYAPLALRNAIVPVAQIGSWISWPMIMLGMFLQMQNLALLGLIAFLALVVFQLVTLPVEFDASNRAKQQIRTLGIVHSDQEGKGVAAVLNAAAMTYVAATVTALAQVIYFALRLGLLGGRSR